MNNPLSFTDPSGYSRLRKGWWRVPVSIAAMFIPLPGINGYVAAFIRGALSRGIATDSLKGAVHGGIQATITYGIAHGGSDGKGWVKPGTGRMLAHATVGGVSAEVDGGKFGHGFASSFLANGADKAGINKFESTFARVVANALVAGTISEVTGGKFSNGAMSAAFRVAFNDLNDRYTKEYEKYVINDESAIELDWQFKYKARKVLTLAVDEGGLDVSLKQKIKSVEIGVSEEGKAYWKTDSGKKVSYDIPKNEGAFMLKRGFKFMSVSVGADNDTNLRLDLTFGVGGFRASAKASANIIGGVLRAESFIPLRKYSNWTDFRNKQMCEQIGEFCN